MKTLADRINFRMSEIGLSQEDLAKLVHVSQAAIQKITSGKTLRPRIILELSAALKVSPEWLSYGQATPRALPATEQRFNNNVEPYDPRSHHQVPLISFVQAGAFCEAIDNFVPGDAEQWLPCPIPHSQHTYALRVKGDSMTSPYLHEASFREGELIYIDPDIEPCSGKFVIAKLLLNNEVTFKKYVEDAGRKWLLPLNPAYEKIEMLEGTHICGVLIFAGRVY